LVFIDNAHIFAYAKGSWYKVESFNTNTLFGGVSEGQISHEAIKAIKAIKATGEKNV